MQRACEGVVAHLGSALAASRPVTAAAARPNTPTGLLIAVAGAVLFAVNGTVSKVALQSGLSSLELVSVRSAGAALVLLGITAVLRPSALQVRWRELRFLAVYGVTGIAMVQWLYFVAIQRMPVGIALLFEYTAPLLVALWVRFVQRQPVRSRLWLGLACALGGLALVAEFWRGMVLDPLGLVSALGAAAALSAYYLMGEHGQRERDPISLMGYSFGFSALLWAVVQPWWTFPFARLGVAVELPGALPGTTPLGLLVLWIVAARHRGAVPAGAAGHPPPRCRPGRAGRDAGAGERRDHRLGAARGVADRAAGARVRSSCWSGSSSPRRPASRPAPARATPPPAPAGGHGPLTGRPVAPTGRLRAGCSAKGGSGPPNRRAGARSRPRRGVRRWVARAAERMRGWPA